MLNKLMYLKTGFRKPVALLLVALIILNFMVVGQPVYAATNTADVTVNANVTGNKVSPLLIGGFSEDLQLAVDGGIYAEKIFNRSFEFDSRDGVGNNTPLAGWTQVNRNGGVGTLTVENSSPLNAVNTHYAHLNVTTVGDGVGISNNGWYGISSVSGTTYNYSLFAKRDENFSSELTVTLESSEGTVYGSAIISSLTTDWVKYTGSITSNTTDQNANLVVVAKGTGDVYLDFISLFPSETYKNRPNGVRNDIGTALEDVNYKFLRFPGGCIIHQYTYQYNWKDQIGPVEGRKEYPNTAWKIKETKEHISNGMGMYEWLVLCEDIGTVAVPCLPVGAKCGGPALDPDGAAMAQLIQDTLDFVEFCNGDATTTWGAERAAMGHPEPFNLQYLNLGNEENDTPNLRAGLTKMYNTVHEAYPSLNLINTAFWVESQIGNGLKFNADLNAYSSDAHYYFPRGNLGWIDYINSYNRSWPQVMIGEYGSHVRIGELEDAIDTAKNKAVFEKNGDIVNMTSWTLLRKIIDFDNANVFKTANYHVDKMWSENLADYNVQFKQSGDPNLVVVAGKDTDTGELILKLINNSANEIDATVAINGMTGIDPTAEVSYVKPTIPGHKLARDSRYLNDLNYGYSTDLNEISTGTSTATISGDQLIYSSPAYSMSVIRVKGTISPTNDAIYEAENFNGGATITPTTRVKAAVKELNTSSSDFWSRADLQGVNEFIQYNDVNVATAGTYNIKVGIKKDANRAITQLSIDGIDQGSPIDQYASSAVNQEVDLGTITLSGGKHTFKFTVTDKNAASSSYTTAVDYILLNDANSFNTMTTGSAPLGWTLDTSVGTVTVQDDPGITDKSVLLSKSDTTVGKKTSMLKTFNPLTGTVTIETKVKRDTTANVWNLPNIYSSDGTLAESVTFDNGDIKVYSGGSWQTVQPFTADTWYTLKLVINTNTDLFDLYINDVKQVDQFALGAAITDISKIEFSAADGNTGDTYVDIESDPSSISDATLSGLVISKGTLPTFAPGTKNYDAGTVGSNVINIDITPTVSASGYQSLTVNGVPSVSGATINVSLVPGVNSIPVVVTAEDGTVDTYTIVISRAIFQSSDASLSGLVISQGTLSPIFALGIKNYAVIVDDSVSSIDITPTATSSAVQSLTVNGFPATSGAPNTVSLLVGANSIPVVVTAEDGTIATFTIDITRLVPQSTANFNDMTTGSIPLGWNLVAGTGTVTVQEVPSSTNKSAFISKTSTATGSKTSMYKVISPLSGIVTVEAKVRRETTGSLWCAPYIYSSDGTMASTVQFDNGNIKANIGGTWQTVQPFTAGTWYTLKEVIDTDTDTFDLYIDGVKKVTQGALRNAVTDISKIEFYAQDFNMGDTYVDIDSEPYTAISDTTLSNLVISQGTLLPTFISSTKNYTANVANSVSSIDIMPTVTASGYQSLSVNGVSSESGAVSTVNLAVGANSIPVVVTAQDGAIATYTIDITRDAEVSNIATLSNLVISPGSLSPTFSSSTNNYTVGIVANSVSSINITPTVTSSAYQNLTVNGVSSESGAVNAVNLAVGANSIPVVVTAQDGTIATYTIDITRDADHSNDNFNDMTTGSEPLGWNFTYRGAGTITVEDVPSATDKSVLINKIGNTTGDKTIMSKTFSPLSGIVVIEAKVKRAGATNKLWCLPFVYSSSGAVAESIKFDTGNIKAYYAGSDKTVQPFSADTWYELKLQINTDTDRFDLYIDGIKKVDNQTLRTAVTDIARVDYYAADQHNGSTYVDIEKEPYLLNDATLRGLEISQGTLSPTFSSITMNYTASVANSVSSIDITPTTNSSGYQSLTVNGVATTPGVISIVNLAVGPNSIPVEVTAADGTTISTYSINITRAAEGLSSDTTLSNLEATHVTLSPTFTPGTKNYTGGSVANSISSIDVTATVSSVYQTLTVNGESSESGAVSTVNLAVGPNSIPVVVTAQDGTNDTYTINVTRTAPVVGPNSGQVGDTNIQYFGRWDKSSPTEYHSYWGGAYLKTMFTGTTASIKLGKQTTLLVNIDDTGDQLFSNVSGTVNLTPVPLHEGTHSIRIAAQYDEKEIVFHGLVLESGATTLTPEILDNPIIEFIGDSVTSGMGCTYGNGDAYAWLVADMLGSEHTQISDPGIALVDGLPTGTAGMEIAYWKMKTPTYTVTNSNWDVSTYTPKVIVVNLGSNDHYKSCDPAVLQTHYIDFLLALRNKYPAAEIFGLRLFNGWYETEIHNAVDARILAGDTKLHYIDTTGWLEGYGGTTSIDYQSGGASVHPTQLGHTKVANNLAPILAPYLAPPDTKIVTLSNLEISQGTLSPAFTPDNTNYTASVANNVSSIDITPTWANASDYKNMTVNGVSSGLGSVSSVNLAVGVNSILVVLIAQDDTTTTYTIDVTRAALIEEATAPIINSNPSDVTVTTGNTATFTVAATASDGGVLTYQWQKSIDNGSSWSDIEIAETTATTPNYTTGALVIGDSGGQYRCVVTNTKDLTTATANSGVATLTVSTLTNAAEPIISAQPQDITVSVNTAAALSVTASASGILTYQWYSSIAHGTDDGVTITDATGAEVQVATDIIGTTYYYCRLTNTDSSATGNTTATAVTTSASVTVTEVADPTVPTITTQPQDKTVSVNGVAILSVTASASGPLSYQWYTNNTNSTSSAIAIDGSTGAEIEVPTSTIGTAYYYCVITDTDSGKTVTTEIAAVNVNEVTVSYTLIYTAGANGTISGTATQTVEQGTSGSPVTATPNSGYHFVKWSDDVTTATRTDSNVTGNIAVSARFKINESSTPDTSGGSGTTTPVPTIPAIPAASAHIEVKPVLSTDKIAQVTLSTDDINNALHVAKTDTKGTKTVTLTVAAIAGAEKYSIGLPKTSLTSSAGNNLKIESPIGTVVVPSNMFDSKEVNGDRVQLAIGLVDQDSIKDDGVKQTVGNRPVIGINATVSGSPLSLSNPEASITVSLDYKPTAEELMNPEHITVWRIDKNGDAEAVPSGRYDEKTGKVTFTTNDFGDYAVVYIDKTFKDIDNYTWATDKIEVMASKGIISGTSETTFTPANNITRADFLVLLVKALGLNAKTDGNFDDIAAGSYFYDAVAIAKSLGLTSGVGDNKFDPKANISRQDMMVLAEKAMRIADKGINDSSAADIAGYNDTAQVAGYAQDSVAALVKEGIIEGSGNKLNPKQTATRAEAAVVIYKIYNK